MKNQYTLEEVFKKYSEGKNVIEYLTNNKNFDLTKEDRILISYDFQAGSYIKNVEKNTEYIESYTQAIANELNQLGKINSILEVGVGEATTMFKVIPKLTQRPQNIYGFDISWSRVRHGIQHLIKYNCHDANLFVADLFNIPLPDSSIEVVYSSHSVEPNGGKELPALEELFRVCSKYLVLLEPSFNFANDKGKARMLKHGYITHLKTTAELLGYKIIAYRLFDFSSNPLNPTELIIIKKVTNDTKEISYKCPVTGWPLTKGKNEYYSEKGLFVYPIIGEVPCLLKGNAILATKFSEFI